MRKFVSLILFFLVVALLFQVDLIFYILYVCLAVYLWVRWSVPRFSSKLTLERQVTTHSFWNEAVDVTLRMKNNTLFPLAWIEAYESLAIELHAEEDLNVVTALRGGETAEFNYQVRTSRRGYYRLGPTRITTGDVFGFVEDQTAFFPASYLTVYPRIYPLAKLGLPSRLPFGTLSSRQRLFEDPARPMGVRDFRSGDAMRQINWKATARTQNLVVNTLQPAISLETMLILDLEESSYNRQSMSYELEWGVEVAASLAGHLTSRRQRVGLLTDGVDPLQGLEKLEFDEYTGRLILPPVEERERAHPIAPANGRVHLMKILEQLARAERINREPFHEWLARTLIPVSWGGTVIVITPKADEALCGVLYQMVKKGTNPILLQTGRTADFASIRQRARYLGFRAFEIQHEDDLQRELR